MDKKILIRLGHYLLMDEIQQKKFKKMLYKMILEEDIKSIVKIEEINIKKRKNENSKLLEIMIKEQLREIKKNEKIQD